MRHSQCAIGHVLGLRYQSDLIWSLVECFRYSILVEKQWLARRLVALWGEKSLYTLPRVYSDFGFGYSQPICVFGPFVFALYTPAWVIGGALSRGICRKITFLIGRPADSRASTSGESNPAEKLFLQTAVSTTFLLMRALADGFGSFQLCPGAFVSWSVPLAFARLIAFVSWPMPLAFALLMVFLAFLWPSVSLGLWSLGTVFTHWE